MRYVVRRVLKGEASKQTNKQTEQFKGEQQNQQLWQQKFSWILIFEWQLFSPYVEPSADHALADWIKFLNTKLEQQRRS